MTNAKTLTEEQSNEKSFFNKKNAVIISIAIICSIIIAVLTILYIVNINWNVLFMNFAKGFTSDNIGWLWFILLSTYVLWKFFITVITITIRLQREGIKVSFFDQFLYTLTIAFLVAVTPANFVSDPYTIFWLKTHGLSTSKASALVVSNMLLWEIAQLAITIPSFIWICIYDTQNIINWGWPAGLTGFIFMIIGITIDFIGLALVIITGYMKHLHYLLSCWFNRIKKFLHLKYHTKEQTYKTYVIDATMQRYFSKYMNDWKFTILILFLVAINEIYYYLTMNLVFGFLKNGFAIESFDNRNVFNIINVSTTANRFFPLPGGMGSLEGIMKVFFGSVGGINPSEKADGYISGSIIVWRSFTQFIPAAIGMLGFIGITIKHIKQYRVKH